MVRADLETVASDAGRRNGAWSLARGRERETREKASLKKALTKAARQVKEMDNKLRQEFFEAARDPLVRENTDMDEGDLQKNFNDAAEFVEGLDKADEEGDDRAPSWKE